MTNERSLPHHLEAERVVLGAMMILPDNIPQVTALLSAPDFYSARHRQIFEAILAVARQEGNLESVDTVTVSDELGGRGQLEEVGGYAYLDSLLEGIPRTPNLPHYAGLVRQNAHKRALVQLGRNLSRQALSQTDPASTALSFERQIKGIVEPDAAQPSFGKTLDRALSTIRENAANPAEIRGIPSGFLALDRLTGGFGPDYWVLAARPGMGKTTLLLNMALYMTQIAQRRCAIFSLEMNEQWLTQRLLAMQANVKLTKLRTGLQPRELTHIENARRDLDQAQLSIADRVLDIHDLAMKARRLHLAKPLDVIMIDYLQLLHVPGVFDLVARATEISRSLKALNTELGCLVLAVAQLSRAPEQRNDKRPILSDLRDSGAIEQDADGVLFLYRHDYYAKKGSDHQVVPAECDLAKHRNGPTGRFKLLFEKPVPKFLNWDDPSLPITT